MLSMNTHTLNNSWKFIVASSLFSVFLKIKILFCVNALIAAVVRQQVRSYCFNLENGVFSWRLVVYWVTHFCSMEYSLEMESTFISKMFLTGLNRKYELSRRGGCKQTCGWAHWETTRRVVLTKAPLKEFWSICQQWFIENRFIFIL